MACVVGLRVGLENIPYNVWNSLCKILVNGSAAPVLYRIVRLSFKFSVLCNTQDPHGTPNFYIPINCVQLKSKSRSNTFSPVYPPL